MVAQGRHRAVGFIGPFDAVLRHGVEAMRPEALEALIEAAADRGIPMGRVCGSGAMSAPRDIEVQMARALALGCRLIAVHLMTSDLPFVGAQTAAVPFFRACASENPAKGT